MSDSPSLTSALDIVSRLQSIRNASLGSEQTTSENLLAQNDGHHKIEEKPEEQESMEEHAKLLQTLADSLRDGERLRIHGIR